MPAQRTPTLHTASLAGLETLLNRALALDPQGREELAELSGCVFALECTAPQLSAYLQPTASGIRLMGHFEGAVTTRVRGRASDFTELASAADPTAALINGELVLEGDSGPLIALQQVVAGLELDWEAPLVQTLGDVAGHQLAQTLRGSFRFSRQAGNSLTRQLDEFIHEEARLSPPRLELEDFYRDVQTLDQRVDRLQSRVKRLQQKLTRLQS